ncbi:DUF1003 domain-containing protein [Nostoc sp. KVJ3]|uniref:DUF1003 domain-containing protein n=1 Tax=Nostoc sp. KVJ3 TaxID=457945 RepID=UPI002238A059|nr:DUF1003 domain-containing protein [Nostoc sp. KVJ3]MCW5316558.1 DUF1003 domain-containing protein [Nostoc sp. KVJ3]
MTHKADDTANKHLSSDTNELKEKKVSRNQVITAPLPDPIAKNIEAIISLHTQEVREIPAHQRILEAIATFFGRSTFMYSLLVILALWIFSSFFDRLLPFNLPAFSWSNQGLDAAALVISTGVLVRQTRQENFAEQRAQLMLQLNLLSEQKIAKIIALLEELRTDLPNVINRHDSEAKLMQEPADPIAVLEALQKNLAEELSATEENNMS